METQVCHDPPVLLSGGGIGSRRDSETTSAEGNAHTSLSPAGTVQFVMNKQKIRSHSKSRRGCSACKARKVKCSEIRPACGHCVRRGSKCVYPKSPKDRPQLEVDGGPELHSSTTVIASLSDGPLNLTDLRLLHHFMLYARPYLPYGHEHVWVTDVLARAREFPHLMHAILALAGTHLGTYDHSVAPCVALLHRQKALEGLSYAMSNGRALTIIELEILHYASVALMFQASYMPNGFLDFITLFRGIGILGIALLKKQNDPDPIFRLQDGVRISREVSNRFKSVEIDSRIPGTAAQSLAKFEHLCLSDVQHSFHKMQLDTVEALQNSSWEGYLGLFKLYNTLMFHSNTAFAQLIGTSDPVAKILQAHLLTLAVVFMPVRLYEMAENAKWQPAGAGITWIEGICNSLGSEFDRFVIWPLQVAKAVKQFGKTNRLSAADLANLVRERPELFF